MLTYKAPIEGKTLEEVLGNVRRGTLSPMGTAMRIGDWGTTRADAGECAGGVASGRA